MPRVPAPRPMVASAAGLLLVAACAPVRPVAPAFDVPMTASAWYAAPPTGWASLAPASLRFIRNEGMPHGTLTLDDGLAVARDVGFGNGTIEFDIKPLGYDDAGIVFRRRGVADGEFFYLRGNPDCPAADDCIQYAPITHARMGWDIYPDEQRPAPIDPQGWNHVRLVIAGDRMDAFLDHQSTPSLVVPRLQGLTTEGGIAFKGAAVFSHLRIAPNSPASLPPVASQHPAPGTITTWRAAAPAASRPDRGPVTAADIPSPAAFRPFAVEPSGLANLGRAFGRDDAVPGVPETAWLATTVQAAGPARRVLQLGWKDSVAVFLDGQLLFRGDNPYYPPERRLTVDGRLDLADAAVPLLLHRGRNALVVAVTDGWTTRSGAIRPSPYGWAAAARITDPSGLTLR